MRCSFPILDEWFITVEESIRLRLELCPEWPKKAKGRRQRAVMNAYSYGERYANDMEPTGERSKGIKPRVNESSQVPVQEGFESHKRTEHNSLPFSAFCLLQGWQFSINTCPSYRIRSSYCRKHFAFPKGNPIHREAIKYFTLYGESDNERTSRSSWRKSRVAWN